ncbi:MAG TPA: MEDS domain-containing protein [Acidothermaceae bacterium]
MLAGTEHFLSDSPGGVRHVVQFYGPDDDLLDTVPDFLLDALHVDGLAIAVATAPHCLAFEARIAAAGVDVAVAKRSGHLVTLDADETLQEFLVDGRPDWAGFESILGGIIRQATASGWPVRIFGEMVSLLWDSGHISAAVEVEMFWDELCRQLRFGLFCAYRINELAGDDESEAFAEICSLHSSVVGAPGARPVLHTTKTFAKGVDAPRAARRFVITTLVKWGDRAFVDDAALVVTELATNAVVHADSDFTVAVSSSPTTVRISVGDASSVAPKLRDASLIAASGRGLGMVASVVSHWGDEPFGVGKVVWAEFQRPASADAD